MKKPDDWRDLYSDGEDDDPLAPARGCGIGIILGILLWIGCYFIGRFVGLW